MTSLTRPGTAPGLFCCDSAETDQRKSRLGAGRQPVNQLNSPPMPVSPFTGCEVKPRTSQGLMCESGLVDGHGQKS